VLTETNVLLLNLTATLYLDLRAIKRVSLYYQRMVMLMHSRNSVSVLTSEVS